MHQCTRYTRALVQLQSNLVSTQRVHGFLVAMLELEPCVFLQYSFASLVTSCWSGGRIGHGRLVMVHRGAGRCLLFVVLTTDDVQCNYDRQVHTLLLTYSQNFWGSASQLLMCQLMLLLSFSCAAKISFLIYFRLHYTYVGIVSLLVLLYSELSSTIDSSLSKVHNLSVRLREGCTKNVYDPKLRDGGAVFFSR